MVTYWILGKDLVLKMFADSGQEVIWMWQGCRWNFKLLGIWNWEGELTCENCHFSSFLAAGNVVQGRTSATQWQKFHTDDINNVYIINLVQSLGSKCKFVQFYISPGRFWKSVVFICEWAAAKLKCFFSRRLYSTNIDCFVRILRLYIWPFWPLVFCLSFVNNS